MAEQLEVSEDFTEVVRKSAEAMFQQKSRQTMITPREVKQAIRDYNEEYEKRNIPGRIAMPISHNNPAHQVAYMIRYYYTHIEVTVEALNGIIHHHRDKLMDILQPSGTLRVCCLGGGPMPEIIALCLCISRLLGIATPRTEEERRAFQRIPSTEDKPGRVMTPHQPRYPLLSVHTLDLHATDWKEYFDMVAEQVYDNGKGSLYIPITNVQPIECDLTEPEQVKKCLGYVTKSNIIFASKVFSDIWSLNPCQVEENAKEILKNIQIGSLLIYMDNQNGNSVSWFTRYDWKKNGFKQLYSYDDNFDPENKMPQVHLGYQRVDPGKQDKNVLIRVYHKSSNSPLRERKRHHSEPKKQFHDSAEYMEEEYWAGKRF